MFHDFAFTLPGLFKEFHDSNDYRVLCLRIALLAQVIDGLFLTK